MESLLLGGRNYCGLTIVEPSFVKFRDGSETESTLFHCFTISKEAQFRWFLLASSHSGWKCYLPNIYMIYFTVIWISLVISEKHSAAMYRGWIQDGDGRGEQNGGHRAVLRGAAGRDEEMKSPGSLDPGVCAGGLEVGAQQAPRLLIV